MKSDVIWKWIFDWPSDYIVCLLLLGHNTHHECEIRERAIIEHLVIKESIESTRIPSIKSTHYSGPHNNDEDDNNLNDFLMIIGIVKNLT